jgi:hypothetical protein
MKPLLILILFFSFSITACYNSTPQKVIVNHNSNNDTVFDEYKQCDSLPALMVDTIYIGPEGEAMNIAPDSLLLSKFISITHDSSAPYASLLLNIDTNGIVTDNKLTSLSGYKIYYNDTTNTAVYKELGNKFYELALKEIRKYPRWKPGYIRGRRVRAMHHVIVVFSKDKVGDDDMPDDEIDNQVNSK